MREIQGCLDERVAKEDLAYRYYGMIDLVAGQVEEARKVAFETPSDIDFVDEEDFDEVLSATDRKPDEERDLISRWLAWAFGFTPHGLALDYWLQGDGADLVAGFYQHKTERIVVKKKGKLDAEYTVLAHELAHAAVDQAFGISARISPHLIDDSTLAHRALVEGDATLTEFRFLSRLTPRKGVKKNIDSLIESRSHFREGHQYGVPYFMTDRFVFPYRWGLAFVCSVFKKRGWRGVDRMYEHPPTSSIEILFPQRYLKGDGPNEPAPLGRPPKEWKLRARGEMGAFHLKTLFEAPGDQKKNALSNPLGRIAAWDGGRYALWAPLEGETIGTVGVALVEHKKYPGVLCSSLNEWYKRTFFNAKRELIDDRTYFYDDEEQDAVLRCDGRDILLGIGPSREIAEATIQR